MRENLEVKVVVSTVGSDRQVTSLAHFWNGGFFLPPTSQLERGTESYPPHPIRILLTHSPLPLPPPPSPLSPSPSTSFANGFLGIAVWAKDCQPRVQTVPHEVMEGIVHHGGFIVQLVQFVGSSLQDGKKDFFSQMNMACTSHH